jgi:predicted enzyme related to lactoylglutathione lyase
MPEHHQIDYLELPAADLDPVKLFFTTVFGWSFTDYGPGYTAFDRQGVDGGFYKADKTSKHSEGAALPVIYSKDLEATQAAVIAANGRIEKDVFDFPGGRRFHFLDPGGNEWAVWSDGQPQV